MMAREMVKFAGIDFYQGEQTFTPRESTEYLVKYILENVDKNSPLIIVDVCTGIGNIPISLALALPEATVYGTDVHENSVNTARRNADYHGLDGRARLFAGNLLDPIMELDLHGRVDVLVSNPPYIPTPMLKKREDLAREPVLALDGGYTGFKYYKGIIGNVGMLMKPGGFIVMEAGNSRVGGALGEMIGIDPFMIQPIPGMDEVIVAARWPV